MKKSSDKVVQFLETIAIKKEMFTRQTALLNLCLSSLNQNNHILPL